MTTFIASVLVFGLLIFCHELGHFIIAKKAGVQVHEFSLGFGPRLAGFKKQETSYNLRAFPLGGFVRMAGMDPDEEEVEEGKAFNDKTVSQRAGIIFAGPLMNFVLAVLLFGFIFFVQGMPVPSTVVDETVPGYPAEEVGFQPGDRIVSIEGKEVNEWDEVTGMISSRPGEEISVTVERDTRNITLEVVPETGEHGEGMIGIYPMRDHERKGPISSITEGVKLTGQITFLIVDFLGRMITGQASADVGGPVRIVHEIGKATELGFFYLLRLAAFLSINLGLFNLFPIPALDGSRIMFLMVEWVRGKPLDPSKENFIHMIGFGLLLMLIVVITYNDVLEIFTNKEFLP